MSSQDKSISIATLASSSSGNCVLVSQGDTHVLVDCGISGSRIAEAAESVGVLPEELSAIFVTHEHIDHIRAVGVVSRRFDLPIYASAGTWAAMASGLGKIAPKNMRRVAAGGEVCINDMAVRPFSISHDASDPLGYSFFTERDSAAVATDMGTMTKEVFDAIKGCRTVLLEANHDLEMLKNGPYPEHLKQRIKSDKGHLSNAFSASVCARLARLGTKKILLGHLSEHNNKPQLAHAAAQNALLSDGAEMGEITLKVADRLLPTVI